jgi:hypothetical protein
MSVLAWYRTGALLAHGAVALDVVPSGRPIALGCPQSAVGAKKPILLRTLDRSRHWLRGRYQTRPGAMHDEAIYLETPLPLTEPPSVV